MKALSIIPGTTDLHLVDRPDPVVDAPDDVKLRVVRVGICGTDREEASGGRARAPAGRTDLVIGHEMFGRVVETGKSVTRVSIGDYAVFTVRRGCGDCLPCTLNRPDMCLTGRYQERGIWGLDGFQSEFVVDREQYIVRVPPELAPVGVLCEPLSVAEKAIDEAVRIQSARIPGAPSSPGRMRGRRCLVAGLGPIGLLAALALRVHEAEVYGLDIVDAESARPVWLAGIGGTYVDGRRIAPDTVDGVLGSMDLIFEATGAPALAFDLLDALSPGGIYVLTGIPSGNRTIQVPGADLIRRMVLENMAMIGSVNASRDHFQLAVDDLSRASAAWGDGLARLISHRHPYGDFARALSHHGEEEIKVVLEWPEAA